MWCVVWIQKKGEGERVKKYIDCCTIPIWAAHVCVYHRGWVGGWGHGYGVLSIQWILF